MPNPSDPQSIESKLDEIVMLMHAMNRRDRLRTMGGFFRGLISIIPIAILAWSTWYFIAHGEELMNRITKQAAEQAQQSVQLDGSFMEQLESMMNAPEPQ